MRTARQPSRVCVRVVQTVGKTRSRDRHLLMNGGVTGSVRDYHGRHWTRGRRQIGIHLHSLAGEGELLGAFCNTCRLRQSGDVEEVVGRADCGKRAQAQDRGE